MSHKLTLDLLENEYWWGGTVSDGIHMPYTTGFGRDFTVNQTSNQAMPLLISNKGRTIWSESGFQFSLNSKEVFIEKAESEIIVKDNASNLKDSFKYASSNYFSPDGKIPNKRLFKDPQYNTWIELIYDQEEEAILNYAHSIIQNGMPTGVFMIDDNWQEDYGVWEFSGTRFNDPKTMVKKLHELGFDVMLWVCPFISADSGVFRELKKKNILLKDKNGNIAIREWWNGYSAVLDLTHPKAVKWFDERLQYLMDTYGIDGFKFDAGDPEFYCDDDQTYLEVSANEHCQEFNKLGLKYPLNEFRASWKTAGLGLAQRLSDKHHSWDENGLGSLIPNGLAQGLMGYVFTCPDMIGGGEYLNFIDSSHHLDDELVVRYAQCSALFPMMQFSAAPWRVLKTELFNYCKEAAQVHVKYSDYIYDLAIRASQTGEPIIRHMAYVYSEGGYEQINTQFMLGDQVVVAPVIEKGATTKTIHIPQGKWKGDDGTMVEGPCTLTVDAPLCRLPYYELVD